jgi:hypothetical protein
LQPIVKPLSRKAQNLGGCLGCLFGEEADKDTSAVLNIEAHNRFARLRGVTLRKRGRNPDLERDKGKTPKSSWVHEIRNYSDDRKPKTEQWIRTKSI